MKDRSIKFQAVIEQGDGGGAYVRFPFDVLATFGTKGRIPVHAVIDSETYRGSLVKYGLPEHMLPMLKAVRTKIGKDIGDTVSVTITVDTEKREIKIPDDLQMSLVENGISERFAAMSYTHQKEYVRWITEAKRPETREKRIAKTIEMVKAKRATQ